MNITDISIKRPAFITSVMIVIITVGIICFKKMNVDLFPNIDVPVIFVSTTYTGAAPSEIEALVTKILEEEVSTISGVKQVTSRSLKDTSQVIVNLYQGTDIKYAEQQVRDKINQAKSKLPEDIKEPVIRRIDPSDQPVMTVALSADLPEAELFDLADQFVSPRLEQASNVGMVEILGARKREIQILLDQKLLKNREVSLSQVRTQLAVSGENVPIGKNDAADKELVFRSASEFNDIKQIDDMIVNFYSNEAPTKISDLGKVFDGLQDEKSRAFVDGKKSLFLDIYRQSDSNIIAVADGVNKQIAKMQKDLAQMKGAPQIKEVKNASKYIRNNVNDVYETIIIAIILTIGTVFCFLGNVRATVITAIALPISLMGAFISMYALGFSINLISLLALSLAVGLLVDDAIVVVENIYRKIEEGMEPKKAAAEATREIIMAVVAITLVVVAVFVPISFMKGIVGQYLKQFGLTIAFSMLVSLLVAVSIIPALCAYLAGNKVKRLSEEAGDSLVKRFLRKFENFQKFLEKKYEKILTFSIENPKRILLITGAILVLSVVAFRFVPKTFIAESNNGELSVSLELAPDSSLDATNDVARKVDEIIRANSEVELSAMSVGSGSSQSNRSSLYVRLKPGKVRKISTTEFKEKLRKQLKEFSFAHPIVKDYDPSSNGGKGQPFSLTLISSDQKLLEGYAEKIYQKLQLDPRLKDVDSSNKDTRSEFRVRVKEQAAKTYGINSQVVGNELRGYVEGYIATKFREKGLEYDVRLRLQPEQRNLRENFSKLYVPNVNGRLIKLSDVAESSEGQEAATINRQDHGRYINIGANLAKGVGLGDVMADVVPILEQGELRLPNDIRYTFGGDSENMQDMQSSMGFALMIAVLFIYLILTSLYESFVTPFTILLALPLALCGAAFALLIAGESVNIFTMLGIFMLIGVSGKNSILLIDFTNHLMEQGKSRRDALIEAGRVRLRPILMTSFALIAGTLPVAIGLSESSSQRTAMGVAIIGGLISSTALTLVVVPAVFSYIDRFRIWIKSKASKAVE
ncbi:MAG: efflux RND transporter permease subunit [Rickettsiales bacterium]|nr:efflux RND transporter permease subunit [Rickettsiales bacterium]